MRKLLVLLFLGTVLRASTPTAVDVLIVVGAPGEATFGEVFAQSARDWVAACDAAKKTYRLIESPAEQTNQLAQLRDALSIQGNGDRELWMVLIGHGTSSSPSPSRRCMPA